MVTDAGLHWPIAAMNLSAIAATLPGMWDSPILPRAVGLLDGANRPLSAIRGVRLWEKFAASTLGRLVQKRAANEVDPFYYSWLNVDYNTSLLAQQLYSVPYFLNASEPYIAEWYVMHGVPY